MAFRGREMMKKVLKKVGEHNLAPGVKESLEKCMPKSKVVMGRAKRGIYAGRHIQFGNSVSEDGGQGEHGNLMFKRNDSSVISWIATFVLRLQRMPFVASTRLVGSMSTS